MSKFYIRKDDHAIMREARPGQFAKAGTVEEWLKLRKAHQRDMKRALRQRAAQGIVTDADRTAAAQAFWDLVDTSAGAAACHRWTGRTRWNHQDPNVKRFKQGEFYYPGVNTKIASRLTVMLVTGQEVPEHMDVTPSCGDHLCCNFDHLTITPHNTTAETKARLAVPAANFFCEGAAA